jgi:hypothetical protein
MNIQFSRVAKYAPTALGALLLAGTALAASYSLFGDAEIVSPGNTSANAAQIRSDADPGFGGIDFTIPSDTTFATLDTLAADFMPEVDDNCFGGSPRFQIRVPETGPADSDPTGDNIFVYFEPHELGDPACTPGVWTSSGDFLSSGQTVDTTQLGGTFYHDYDDAVADFGSLEVTEVSLVVDSGWGFPDGEQTFIIDNVNVDGTITTFEPEPTKDSCKNGGWQSFTSAPGPFKNQGQCVSHFARNK